MQKVNVAACNLQRCHYIKHVHLSKRYTYWPEPGLASLQLQHTLTGYMWEQLHRRNLPVSS